MKKFFGRRGKGRADADGGEDADAGADAESRPVSGKSEPSRLRTEEEDSVLPLLFPNPLPYSKGAFPTAKSAVEKAEVKNSAEEPFYRPFHTFHLPGKLWKGYGKIPAAGLFHSLSFQHKNHAN